MDQPDQMEEERAKTRITPGNARSWLLVPATHADTFDRATRSGADAGILDIEDAVDPSNKPNARADVVAWLSLNPRAP